MRFQTNKKPVESTGRQVVHDVDILDASGSMEGEKYSSAINGINHGIEEIKKDDSVDYTKTVIEFDSGYRPKGEFKFNDFTNINLNGTNIMEHCFMAHKTSINSITGFGARGGTPLYQTVGETIEKLLTKVSPTDKVLIKIFTDGGENSSQGKYSNPRVLKQLMDKVQAENNFTITFIGTKFDVEKMVNTMGISQLNSLVHDNTSRGIQKAYNKMSNATIMYSSAVADGSIESNTLSFFKGVKED